MCIHTHTHMTCYNHIHKNLEATKETATPTAETHNDPTKAPNRENQPQEQHCLPASTLPCKAKFCFFGKPAKKHEHKQRHEVPAEDTHTHTHTDTNPPRLGKGHVYSALLPVLCFVEMYAYFSIYIYMSIHLYVYIIMCCMFSTLYVFISSMGLICLYILYIFYI